MIFIYSSDSCAPCVQLKRWLDGKEIAYKVLDADADEHNRKLIAMTGRRILPTTVIGDEVIRGLNIGLIAQALRGQGLLV